jgi:hypothetical protein
MSHIDGHRAGRHESRPHARSRAGRRRDSSHHSHHLVRGSPATSIPLLIDQNRSRVLGEVASLEWIEGDGLMAVDPPSLQRARRCTRRRRLVVLRWVPLWPSGPTWRGRRPTPPAAAPLSCADDATGYCGQALAIPGPCLGLIGSRAYWNVSSVGRCHRTWSRRQIAVEPGQTGVHAGLREFRAITPCSLIGHSE